MPREALDKKYKPATCLTPKSARSAHRFHPFVRDQINLLKSLNRAASMTEEAPRHALSLGATLSATAQALSRDLQAAMSCPQGCAGTEPVLSHRLERHTQTELPVKTTSQRCPARL